jgi:hypothetical protein
VALYNVRMRSSRTVLSRMTRRQLTALLGSAPLIAQVTQKTPPVGSPSPAAPSATPEQKLQKAFADVHDVSGRLAEIEVPMDVEPAFAFRA